MVWHHMRMAGASRAWTSGHVTSATIGELLDTFHTQAKYYLN